MLIHGLFPLGHISRSNRPKNAPSLAHADNEKISSRVGGSIYEISVFSCSSHVRFVDTCLLYFVGAHVVAQNMIYIHIVPIECVEYQNDLAIYEMSIR